jgi:hypothetical protein
VIWILFCSSLSLSLGLWCCGSRGIRTSAGLCLPLLVVGGAHSGERVVEGRGRGLTVRRLGCVTDAFLKTGGSEVMVIALCVVVVIVIVRFRGGPFV